MQYYGMSDIGKKRTSNQDSYTVRALGGGALLLVVCDGMGGARGGAIASKMALEAFAARCEEAFSPSAPEPLRDPGEISAALAHAVSDANFALWQRAQADAALHGMGTTLAAALFTEDTMYVVNVGDSRLYHMAQGLPIQVSHDHSLVQHLVDSGKLTLAEARRYPGRNVITRCIGAEPNIAADVFLVPLCREGGYVLLCSDGLTNELSVQTLYDTVTGRDDRAPCTSAQLAARVGALIALANEAGGGDNITALVAWYEPQAQRRSDTLAPAMPVGAPSGENN